MITQGGSFSKLCVDHASSYSFDLTLFGLCVELIYFDSVYMLIVLLSL